MPPKKSKGGAAGETTDNRLLLGRFKSTLKCGVVGLPNVGKSTFFSLLTKTAAEAANYPFCTIEPNTARTPVPDARFDELVAAHKPKSEVPAFFQLWDIAGLVKGAAEGAGLGNKFLSHISAVDGIMHVLRIFEDDDVTHVDGNVDPVRDLETIHDELRAKDIQTVKNRLESFSKAKRETDKRIKAECEILAKVLAYLEKGGQVRHAEWNGNEIEVLNELLLLTSKPAVYLLNLSAKDYCRKKNKWLMKVKTWLDEHCPKDPIIPFSCAYEQELLDLPDDAAREAHCKETGAQSALPKIITTGYHHLRLIHFFTAGSDEVKCWTIREQTKAPQAAGTIHTDMEKGFIMAEVMSFEDWKEKGGEQACRKAGRYRNEGKNYVVQDGDIIYFQFNAAKGKK